MPKNWSMTRDNYTGVNKMRKTVLFGTMTCHTGEMDHIRRLRNRKSTDTKALSLNKTRIMDQLLTMENLLFPSYYSANQALSPPRNRTLFDSVYNMS